MVCEGEGDRWAVKGGMLVLKTNQDPGDTLKPWELGGGRDS